MVKLMILAAAGVWLARWLNSAERDALAESAGRQKVPRLAPDTTFVRQNFDGEESLPFVRVVRNGTGW